jgi:putative peptidoglycan lipid II flippase
VALVNFFLLALFMRRRLGRLEGRRLGSTVVRICFACIPMAAVAWSVNELFTILPLTGVVMRLIRVAAAISLAGAVFYFICRRLGVAELDDAVGAVAGRIARPRRRKSR